MPRLLPPRHRDYPHTERLARHLGILHRLVHGRTYMPEIDYLAKEIGVTRRTVFRYLRAVEHAGWLLPRRWEDVA